MSLRDQIVASIVRTSVPVIVAAVLSVSLFADLDSDALTVIVSGGVASIAYAVVRVAESFLSPLFGWFLALPKAPNYEAPAE